MKTVLVPTFTTPGYAPNELISYLESKRKYDIDAVTIEIAAQHERKYIIGWSHLQNYCATVLAGRVASRQGNKKADIGIAPDPSLVFALNTLKRKGIIDKVIYWRLDYYPKYKTRIVDKLYQTIERKALEIADEIWSICDPQLAYVEENLALYLDKVKYVPYLMHQNQIACKILPEHRENMSLWMGPDLDGSRTLFDQANQALNISSVTSDYSRDDLRLDEITLGHVLRSVKVGVALYKPEPLSSKRFADVSRVRRFLAYGVPVVTTNVSPTHSTVVEENCGYISDWNVDSVVEGIKYCFKNFATLTENAQKAAEKYTYEYWFETHQPTLL